MFNQALACDGYRCMITSMSDGESLKKSVVLCGMTERDGANGLSAHTHHILNELTTQGIDTAGSVKAARWRTRRGTNSKR
jgi:hypothetical protein